VYKGKGALGAPIVNGSLCSANPVDAADTWARAHVPLINRSVRRPRVEDVDWARPKRLWETTGGQVTGV
jgi:hypothetical protein